jgi:tripartite-type tricarboxylate transporter receptor subunit TctC
MTATTKRRTLLALAGGTLAAPGVRAQGAWPDRPVRFVIPFPPGGSNDTVARILQPRLQEILGRPIVIDNRGGASGSVGAGEAARAAPDGYTWALVNDTLAANDTLMQLPYKAVESFSYATVVGTCPYAFVCRADAPFRSFADVVAAAKRAPDTLNYATTGSGSLAHIATVLLSQRAEMRLVHVPYRGGGPALQDVLAGHVPLFMSNIVILLPHLRAGTLRALGVSSAQPSRFMPGTPTFVQLGFPGFEALTYWALVGPAGIPQPIVDRMQDAIARTLQDATVRARMDEQGADILASTPAQTAAFIRAEAAKWGQVIRDANIRAES